jgi:hypothetical protein
LKSEDFAFQIERRLKPAPLQLVGEKHVENIQDIPIEQLMNETNTGGSYVPGDKAQKVRMFKEVQGSDEIFEFLAKNSLLPRTNSFYAGKVGNMKAMIYQGYARNITHNKALLEELKNDSNLRFDGIKNQFDNNNSEIEKFFTNELNPLILQAIEYERQKRSANESAIDALK